MKPIFSTRVFRTFQTMAMIQQVTIYMVIAYGGGMLLWAYIRT